MHKQVNMMLVGLDKVAKKNKKLGVHFLLDQVTRKMQKNQKEVFIMD